MKKIIPILLALISNMTYAQEASSLSIADTRSTNESPGFFGHQTIKADFKLRDAIGVPGDGGYSTNLTIGQWSNSDNSGNKRHQINFNDGGLFYRNANPLDSQWGSWRQILMANENGNVGIGTTTPDAKLTVNGTIHSKEVKVDMNGWSDFVFKKEYNLPTLIEVEKQINENGHLANIPSETEVLKNGISLGEMNAKLLQKIEELTLYVIEQNKVISSLKKEKQNTEILALKLEKMQLEINSLKKN